MDEKTIVNEKMDDTKINPQSCSDKEEFDFKYSAPNSEEKRWIESIRREYLPSDEHDAKVEEIKKLHKKAKKIPSVIAVIVGIIGTLTLGAGMSMTLEFDQLIGGIIVGIFGMAVMLLAYPLYQFMVTRGKKKYGDRILKLTKELTAHKDEKDAKLAE